MSNGQAQSNVQAAQQKLESVRSEKFIRIYSNSCTLDIIPWDFSFTFGEMKRQSGVTQIEEQVTVVMSPQHAN